MCAQVMNKIYQVMNKVQHNLGKTRWHEGLTCAQNQAEEPEEAEDASLREIAKEQGWKTCPGCKNMVERNRGCNHMTCRCHLS